MDVFRIGVSMALTSNASALLGVIAKDFMGVRGEIGKTEAAMGRLKGVMVGLGAVMAGGAILSGVGKLVEHGRELVHQQALMAEQGMTVREQADATAAAYKTASDVLGTSVSKNAALIRELRGVLGNSTDAMTALPEFSKAGLLMSSMKGAHNENDLQTLAKALELRGDLINPKTGKIDPDMLKEGLNQAFRTMSASGGLISPQDLMGVTKQAGPMARMMTAQQFYDTAFSAIMEMGGQRAGTALSAVGRAIYGGIMPKRNAMEFERLKLLDPNAVQHLGAGATQINPAGFKGVDTLSTKGLLAYVQDVIKPAMEAAGIKSGSDQQKELYRLFPTETARRMIGLFLQQAETVTRDVKLRAGAQGVDQAYDTGMKNDPTMKIEAFHKAWDNLMTSLGAPLVGPATDALVWMARKVDQAALFFSQHQEAVKIIGAFTAAFGGLLVLSGSVAIMSIALGPFSTALRLLGGSVVLFANGSAGASALSLLTGAGGLSAVAGKLVTLGAAVAGLAGALAVPLAMIELQLHGPGAPKNLPSFGDIYDKYKHSNFSLFDRSTWSDPKAHVWNAEPKPINLNGTLNIDGKKMGTFTAQSFVKGMTGTQGGMTGHDGSMSLFPSGLPAGAGN